MASDEATCAQEPAAAAREHRLVSFALLIVCGGTFGLIFSANKIAVTGGIPFFASAIMVFPFIEGSGQRWFFSGLFLVTRRGSSMESAGG